MPIYLTVVLSDEEAKDRINNLKLKALALQYEAEVAKYKAEEAEQKGIDAEEQAEIAKKAAEEAARRSRESYHMVMTMMRTSYLMFAGMGRIMGGGMTMMFRTMYTVAMAAIGTYKAIAAAQFASGVGVPQAMIMMASLVMASAQLYGVMTGQRDMARTMRGFNMMLHGISGMIGSYSVM